MRSDGPVCSLRDLVAEVVRRLPADKLADAADHGDVPLPPFPPLSGDSRIALLARRCGLGAVEVGLLAAALAPALEPRIAAYFVRADQPLCRGNARVDVAMSVAGGSWWSAADRSALDPRGSLVRGGLLHVDPLPSRPLGLATLRPDDRLIAHLLGDDRPDRMVEIMAGVVAPVATGEVAAVADALRAGFWSLWLRERHGGGASVAAAALASVGMPAAVIDLRGDEADMSDAVVAGLREAVLSGGALVVSGIRADRDRLLFDRFADPPRPMLLVSDSAWPTEAFGPRPVEIDITPLDAAQRTDVWRTVLNGIDGLDTHAVSASLAGLCLAPEQIVTSAAAAECRASAGGLVLDGPALRRAALSLSADALGSAASRVEPTVSVDDLVLPKDVAAEIAGIADRYRTLPVLRDVWNLAGRRGLGIACLFSGSPGTGKTMAAEAVAHALGVDMFVVDLSAVVDKYIGETEKNLERIFAQAERLNGVLVFDEADALFGKRSKVQDAHDRNANVGTAYLLQRLECFEGVAVLTTNLRSNFDEAFTRRLDVICTFPDPDEEGRLGLWQRHLPPQLPCTDDIDLPLLAKHMPLTGGVIRNITRSAAHAAAAEGTPVSMRMLLDAAAREYRQRGELFDSTPFRCPTAGGTEPDRREPCPS